MKILCSILQLTRLNMFRLDKIITRHPLVLVDRGVSFCSCSSVPLFLWSPGVPVCLLYYIVTVFTGPTWSGIFCVLIYNHLVFLVDACVFCIVGIYLLCLLVTDGIIFCGCIVAFSVVALCHFLRLHCGVLWWHCGCCLHFLIL